MRYVEDLANLASQQYLYQAGVELPAQVWIDTRQHPEGHSYATVDDTKALLEEFRDRWDTDVELVERRQGFAMVHLISGKELSSLMRGMAWMKTACKGHASSVSWVSHLDDTKLGLPKICQLSLLMHETGHMFSLGHVENANATMNIELSCKASFLPASAAQIREWVDGYIASGSRHGPGCSCGAGGLGPAPIPEPRLPLAPPPPPPEVECASLGAKECRALFRLTGECVKVRGRGCVRTKMAGAECAGISERRWCRRAGCSWGRAPAAAAAVAPGDPGKRQRRGRGRKICRN